MFKRNFDFVAIMIAVLGMAAIQQLPRVERGVGANLVRLQSLQSLQSLQCPQAPRKPKIPILPRQEF